MIKLFLLFCIFNNSNTLAININRKPNIKNIDDKIYYLLLFYILSEKYNEITYYASIIFDEEDKEGPNPTYKKPPDLLFRI